MSIETLFFAVLAGIIFFKLFNVLGRRTGHEQPPSSPLPDSGADAAEDEKVVPPRPSDESEDLVAGLDAPLKAGVTRIQLADRTFDLEQFLAGARSAFEMILDAYHKGDLERVKTYLDSSVYRSFTQAVEERDVGDTTRMMELVAINKCEPIKAEMKGREAHITMRFESDQTDIVKDSEERIVAGDPTHPVEVIDIWTFARDTRSRDPNWQLVATRSPN